MLILPQYVPNQPVCRSVLWLISPKQRLLTDLINWSSSLFGIDRWCVEITAFHHLFPTPFNGIALHEARAPVYHQPPHLQLLLTMYFHIGFPAIQQSQITFRGGNILAIESQ